MAPTDHPLVDLTAHPTTVAKSPLSMTEEHATYGGIYWKATLLQPGLSMSRVSTWQTRNQVMRTQGWEKGEAHPSSS